MPVAELRARLGDPPARLFARMLAREGSLQAEGERVRAVHHQVAMGDEEAALKRAAANLLAAAALAPPVLSEAARLLSTTPERLAQVMKLLAAEGTVVKVKDDLYFDARALGALRERLVAHLQAHREISTQDFKEMVGQSRKFVIPLSEHFDREKLTLRVGERRILRGGAT